jgi:hypothetical protein
MTAAGRIALLGWGSLLWEDGSELEAWHEPWLNEGPILRIEFSRVSSSRGGALTLVIDPENGVPTMVAYCLSRRSDAAEAIEDLRARERTTVQNIGWVRRNGEAGFYDQESVQTVLVWAAERDMDAVVWAGLRSNFAEKVGRPFSVEAARTYLLTLSPEGKAKALDYVRRAPLFVRTPLRDALADIR